MARPGGDNSDSTTTYHNTDQAQACQHHSVSRGLRNRPHCALKLVVESNIRRAEFKRGKRGFVLQCVVAADSTAGTRIAQNIANPTDVGNTRSVVASPRRKPPPKDMSCWVSQSTVQPLMSTVAASPLAIRMPMPAPRVSKPPGFPYQVKVAILDWGGLSE